MIKYKIIILFFFTFHIVNAQDNSWDNDTLFNYVWNHPNVEERSIILEGDLMTFRSI